MNTSIKLFKPELAYAGLHNLDFTLNKNDLVLDIGGGQNTFPRANIVLEKFSDDNSQRLGRDLSIREGQQLIIGDADNIPFPDKHFRMVFSSHVFEHIENLPKAIDEINRVSEYCFAAFPKGDFDRFVAKRTWGHVNFLWWLDGVLFIKKRTQEDFSDFFSSVQHSLWHGNYHYNEHFESLERDVWETRLFVKTPLLYKVIK